MNAPFLSIEMLPAKHGDGLWIEYGDAPRARRILIDGGPINAFPALAARIARLPEGDQRVELLVITHVDTDHIEAIIRLLAAERARWPLEPQDIWFNGYRHMAPQRDLGGREGEFLSALLHRRAYDEWNRAFQHGAAVVGHGELPRIELADGMSLTLLSPDRQRLAAMRRCWEKSVAEWEMTPGDLDGAWKHLVEAARLHPGEALTLGPEDLTAKLLQQLKGVDGSAANGSSIAFLAEFAGKSCLFLADAQMSVVCASLRKRGASRETPLRVDAVKMAHHGSRNNVTREFLELVDAEHFLFSSNGDRFRHPDTAAVAAVIAGARRQPTLWFNYRTEYTLPWQSDSRAICHYPEPGQEGITLRL